MATQSLQTADPRRAAARLERPIAPATDIYETAEAVVVLADMPGVTDRDVEVTLESHVLTLRGAQTTPAREDAQAGYVERGACAYERTFELDFDLDPEGVEARMKDGVLEVRLPKTPAARPRKIEVRAS